MPVQPRRVANAGENLKTRIEGVLGRLMMSIGTGVAGFVPLLVDLSPTHVLNPAWPAHARLHEVWLLATGSLLALLALHFIWFYRDSPRFGVAMGAVLGSALLGGFFVASATSSLRRSSDRPRHSADDAQSGPHHGHPAE
jgi:hypothetical protein